jgi:hypothetical protein
MTIRKTILLGALLGALLSPSPYHTFAATAAAPSPGDAVSPHLHVDPGGALYLIWNEIPDSQAGLIYFNRSADGGQSWPKDAHGLDGEKPGGARSSSPRLASDGHGHVYAAWWTKYRDGAKDVLMRTSRDGGASFGTMAPFRPRSVPIGRAMSMSSGPMSARTPKLGARRGGPPATVSTLIARTIMAPPGSRRI